jgi:DNA end-binding protein Ku
VPRAMWKGAIQFGLVTIPVKLYLATESKGIAFNMLHEKDLSRIQMKIWCPEDEAVIPRGETVKGFEWAPDQYVVITDEDLEKVPLKTVRSIEIELFTKPERTDGNVRFVKSAYYLEPDKIGRKAFYLLRQVLEEEGLTAICKVVIKDREALAALDPFDRTMLLTTLHWPDEIRAVGDLDLPEEVPDYKPTELSMAKQLVSAMTGEFEPENFKDEYREALMQVIDSKVEGKEPVTPKPAEETGKLIDLMAALEASVEAAKAARDSTGKVPVSVKAARAARAGRGSDATAAQEKGAPRRAASHRGGDTEEEPAKPARRRRSA